MPRIALPEGVSVHCIVDDFLWPWDGSTPVLMMHGFARNATFWNRWVPAIAETHRVYRPDLLGCGLSDQPPGGYRYTPETIGAQILALLDGLSLPRVHWVGESSGGIIGLLLAAAHPDRVASLVLCNTPTQHSRPHQAHLRVGPCHRVGRNARHWCRCMVPPDPRQPARPHPRQ
jgi:pimeloyl-ACP methyl ester carboxylesterase